MQRPGRHSLLFPLLLFVYDFSFLAQSAFEREREEEEEQEKRKGEVEEEEKRRGRRRGRGGEGREEGGGELTDGPVELNWRDRTSRLMPTSISSAELLLIVLELVSTGGGGGAGAASCKTFKMKVFQTQIKRNKQIKTFKIV